MTAAIDLSPHLRAARRTLLYLVVGLGQGLTYLLVIGGGLALGVLLAPLWIGLPLLAGTARLTWRLAEGERRQANRLLASHIPPVPPPPPGRGVREQLGNRTYWRIAAMLLLKLPTVLLGLVVGLRAGAAGDRARRARRQRARRRRRAARRAVGARAVRRRSRCACWRCRRRSCRSRCSRRSGTRCARVARRLLAHARRRERARARDAGRAARGPLAEHRLLAARARDLRRRRRAQGRAARTPARGARGPRSSTRACAWRRSSTTRSSTRRRSSSPRPPPPPRSRSTTSG